MAEELWNGDF